MNFLVHSVTAAGLTALLLSHAASAPRCITSLPKERSGYWHYRIINGQKCWYSRGQTTPMNIAPTRTLVIEIVPWGVHNSLDDALDWQETIRNHDATKNPR